MKDDVYWNRIAKNYDRSMLLLSRPLPRMLEMIREHARGANDVLEVAAGTGLVTSVLARSVKRLTATDYAPAMVAMVAARVRREQLDNVDCLQADLYELPFEPRRFDMIVAANVLHLVPDLAGAFHSLKNALRPGGRLVVPTFCHDQTRTSWLASRVIALSGFPGHRRFTSHSLAAVLREAGLEIYREEVIPGLIPIAYFDGVFQGRAQRDDG